MIVMSVEERLKRKLKREVDLSKFEPVLLRAGELEVLVLVEDKNKFIEYLKFLKTFASEINVREKRARWTGAQWEVK
jgi:hypothetical protein